MAYSRTFSRAEILAMAGYQLDPGHSDLDDEQPMAVRIVEWNARDLRCLLGDIRKAKADFFAGALQRDRLLAALTAMLEETEGLVTLERRGLGLARYQALEAVEVATGVPFTPSRQQEPAR